MGSRRGLRLLPSFSWSFHEGIVVLDSAGLIELTEVKGTIALTRREREIAVLVAQGMTNRQIADRLFIGERTAEGHVEQIRNKLGFHSRSQIAAWAVEKGLLQPGHANSSMPARQGVPRAPLGLPTRGLVDATVASTEPAPRPATVGALRRRTRRELGLIGAVAVLVGALVGTAIFQLARGNRSVTALTFSTVAGVGGAGYSGDGGPAIDAELLFPSGLALDRGGHLYIVDSARIRKVELSSGVITTVAGNGTQGYSGDGGSALLAQIFTLSTTHVAQGLAVDAAGRYLYIADNANNVVRRVDQSTGIIITVVGNGTQGFSGDGGLANSARLSAPRGLAIDGTGNLYIADSLNNRVRKVDLSSGVITTFAGAGDAGFSGDGGPPVAARLDSPQGLAFSEDGYLYIADALNNRIRAVSPALVITTVAGRGDPGFSGDGRKAREAGLNLPVALAVDSKGILYIADSENHRVRKVDLNGVITTVAELGLPLGVGVDANGSLYIADTANNRIRKVRP